MSEINLNAQVKLSDVLALLQAGTCLDYLCHNVAYLMREQIATIPGFKEYESDFLDNDSGNDHQRIGAIPYYFLVDDTCGREIKKHNEMSPQVITQVNNFMVRINPDLQHMVKDYLSEMTLSYFRFRSERYCCDSRQNRIAVIQKILRHFPDAVFEISL